MPKTTWSKHLQQAKTTKQPLHKTHRKFIANQVKQNKDKGWWYQDHAPREIVKARRKGEIILGFRDPDTQSDLVKINKEQRRSMVQRKRELLNNKVSLQHLGSGVSIIISGGMRGSGKSVLASLIGLDQLAMEDNHYMAIDPQSELHFHTEPNTNDEELFQSLDMQPIGHSNLRFYTPYFLKDNYSKQRQGSITQLNSNNLHYNDLKSLFKSHLPSGQKKALLQRFEDWLYKYLKEKEGYDLKETSITGKTPPKIQDLALFIAEQLGSEKKVNRDKVIRTMRGIMTEGVLGDNYPFHDPLVDMEQDRIPILQTSTMREWSDSIAAYIAPTLKEVYRDREKRQRGMPHRLKKKQFILQCEEADVIYPMGRSLPVKRQIKNFLDQGRQLGCGILFTSPNFSSIANDDDSMLLQQSIVITARVQTIGEKRLLKKKLGVHHADRRLRKLEQLEFHKENLLKGMAPAEFAVIDTDGSIETFYPIPSFSAFKVENLD